MNINLNNVQETLVSGANIKTINGDSILGSGDLTVGGGTTTTVVNISSAQILAMGTTPVELLPTPGAGKYYDIEKIILEYTYVTTAYTLGDVTRFRIIDSGGMQYTHSDALILTELQSCFAICDMLTPFGIVSTYEITQGYGYVNSSFEIKTVNDLGQATDPTLGDGTIRAIITYTVRTFGA